MSKRRSSSSARRVAAAPEAFEKRPRWPWLLPGLLVCATILLVHGQSLGFDFSRLDDDHLLINRWGQINRWSSVGPAFREPFFPANEPVENFYRPLISLSWTLDAVGHEQPTAAPFHRTNLALHLLGALLFLALLRRLGFDRWTGALLTLLFAVHPALTMAVAWIPGRTDVLMTVFGLASWLAFLRYREGSRPLWFLLHLFFFGCALLTKEAAVLLPLALIAQRALLDGERPDPRRDRWLWASWAGLAAVWLVVRSQIFPPRDVVSIGSRLKEAAERLPALAVYLGKLVVPVDLAPLSHQEESSLLPGLLALAVVVALVAFLRGRARRLALFGLAVFLLFLAPALPVTNTLLLENRLYLPLMGIAILAGAAVSLVPPRLARMALGVAIVALGISTVAYSRALRDPSIFAEAILRTTPKSALAHATAASTWQHNGDLDRAEAGYRRSLELDPTQRLIHGNLGVFALRRNELEVAEREFRIEIQRSPDFALAQANLATALWRLGRPQEAAAAWARAIRLEPSHRENLVGLWQAYLKSGETGLAGLLEQSLADNGVFLSEAPR